MRFRAIRNQLLLLASGGILLASGCPDSTQLEAAASSGVQAFLSSLINVLVQSAINTTLGT